MVFLFLCNISIGSLHARRYIQCIKNITEKRSQHLLGEITIESLIIGILFPIASAGIIGCFQLWKRIKTSEMKHQLLVDKSIQSLLKSDMKRRATYYFHFGYTTMDEKELMAEQFECYHALGQDGVFEPTYHKFMNLPIQDSVILSRSMYQDPLDGYKDIINKK